MDGVLIKGKIPIPGAVKFIKTLTDQKINYLVLTNNPLYTARDLSHRLSTMGIDIPKDRIFTSAMAMAHFVSSQNPSGKAFVIGDSGLTQALYDVNYIITETNPNYVILGETLNYNFDVMTKAIRLISGGALFVATNPDNVGREEEGLVPACGALAALLETTTGKKPFFVGKPNPLMMRYAMNYLGIHSENTIMVGDRMDTDVMAGIMAGLETILVLSGVSSEKTIKNYPYRPTHVIKSVAEFDI